MVFVITKVVCDLCDHQELYSFFNLGIPLSVEVIVLVGIPLSVEVIEELFWLCAYPLLRD